MSALNGACAAEAVGTFSAAVTTLVQALLIAQCEVSAPQKWPLDYGDIALENGLGDYDFVVIGAGSAGSVVASRLSENPNWNVLLLEAGGDPPQESEIPVLFANIQRTNYTWNYFALATQRTNKALKNEVCYWPRGKFLGGTGGINAMLYVRGNSRDYDRWSDLGNTGWSWKEVTPYFEKSVDAHGNRKHSRGYVAINKFPRHNENIRKMLFEGAVELGVPSVERFEEGSFIGYSSVPGYIKDGERQSSAKGYLAAIPERSNLHIIRHAEATKINFDASGKIAKSVTIMLRNQVEMTVNISKELVLSAGTINTPKLLMLSGIGPKEHLKALSIPVVHDLHVGDNLQDHISGIAFFKINENQAQPISQTEQMDSIYEYLVHRRGLFVSDNFGSWTGFINTISNSKSPYPDIEMHYYLFRRGTDLSGLKTLWNFKAEYEQQISDLIKTSDLMSVLVSVAHPKSIGKIRLSSVNPQDHPIIDANYFSDLADEDTLVRGFKYLDDLEGTLTFRKMNASLVRMSIPECDPLESEQYWRCYVKYFTSTLYHHVGTVKMGQKNVDPTACVDEKLRLYGVENLRVADASIMPFITSGNTNAPTMMIAEKAADFIREKWWENQSNEL